ncbi:hypothetical protein PO656_02515, partial [Enterobacter kobei]|uniref:hypothetical protein n=1 Tax=Enterobacter kobei TaxID=208224 RepID=UPI002FFCB9AB
MNIFQHGIKKTFSIAALLCASVSSACYAAETVSTKEGANKQVISSQADSLIKISRIWADF